MITAKFKGDGSDSHRWREVKDQVLNKSMSQHGGFKMSLLETKPVPDETIYQNATGVMTTSGKEKGGNRGEADESLRSAYETY